MISVFDGLKWKKICFSLLAVKEKHEYRIPSSFVVNSIVKSIDLDMDNINHDKVFFHILDRAYYYTPNKNSKIDVEVFFLRENYDLASQWLDNLIAYFSNEKNSKNYQLLDGYHIKERTYAELYSEFDEVDLEDNEFTLQFLSPMFFNPLKGRTRLYLNSYKFMEYMRRRFYRFFNIEFPNVNIDIFQLLPYYWSYSETRRHSKSQNNIHIVKGCIGNLYIRGNLKEVYPYLILGSELHAGNKIGYSYGYYKLHLKSLPALSSLLYNYDFYKKVFHQFESEFDDFDEIEELDENLCKKVFGDFVNDTYENDPVAVFFIDKGNGEKREIHKPSVKDMFAHKVLAKLIDKPLDNAFEEESIGYRKGCGRHKVVQIVNELISQGFKYVIESDIEDFFPSIDHNLLEEILKDHIPRADLKIVNLLLKSIKTKIPRGDKIEVLMEGLSLGSPISPILANLYLDYFDEMMKLEEDIKLIRYADDFIILLKDIDDAKDVLLNAEQALKILNLELNKEKTFIKSVNEGFTFLGFNFTGDGVVVEKSYVDTQYKKPLFVTEPFTFLGVRGNRVEIKKNKEVLLSVPIKRISEILLLEKCSISSYLIKRCSDYKIPISLTLNSGYYITTIKPDKRTYYDTLVAHTNRYFGLTYAEVLEYAKTIAFNKVFNYNTMLKLKREYDDEMKSIYATFLDRLQDATTLNEIRGIEGFAAKNYYRKLNEMIIPKEFKFKKRARFGFDRMNPLLNYGYYLLYTRINALIRAVGLNPFLGFLHSPENKYESLVADIQELFRPFVDRFLVRIINLQSIKPDDFTIIENKYRINSDARKKFLSMYEAELNRKNQVHGKSILDMLNHQVKNIILWVKEGSGLNFFRWEI